MTSNVVYQIDWEVPMSNLPTQMVQRYECQVLVNGGLMASFDSYTNNTQVVVPQGMNVTFTVAAWDNFNQRGADASINFNSDSDPVNLIPSPFGMVGNLRYTFIRFE